VIVFPEPNVAAVEVRGAAPGSRETALLRPGMRIETVQAIVLAGGSAFGLAAADGVVAALEREGKGHPTPAGVVPIVPAAIIFDLMVGDPTVRPGPTEGAAAYGAAGDAPVESGSVGAGTGAVVAGWRGREHVRPGGLGSFAVHRDGAVVGALAVVNAAGDVFTLEGEPLTEGPLVPGPPAHMPADLQNTTLVVLATDARLDRLALSRLTVRAQDAVAACVRPSHTRYDGDAAFAVSCGSVEADLDGLGEAAFEATGRAIESALRTVTATEDSA
jgi:L-aminopeptidase/D-esterase-like protein